MKEALESCTNISLTDFVANVDKEMRHIFPNILNYFHLENLSLNTFRFYIYNMLGTNEYTETDLPVSDAQPKGTTDELKIFDPNDISHISPRSSLLSLTQ